VRFTDCGRPQRERASRSNCTAYAFRHSCSVDRSSSWRSRSSRASSHCFLGPAGRNRTCITRFEASEVIHYPTTGLHHEPSHPCPATGAHSGPCGGYVVDHVIPLACGGPDPPNNMQWQNISEAKNKDRWELKGCRPHLSDHPL
jgi:hypothetical protein